jgi:hypothetical protein
MLKASSSRAFVLALLFLALSISGEVHAAAQGPSMKPLRVSSSFSRAAVPGLLMEDAGISFDLSSLELSEPSDDEGEEAEEEEDESERHKRLKKLKFDRRPSAALAAWANVPVEEEQETEPDTDAASETSHVLTIGMSEEEAAEAIADAEKAAERARKKAEKDAKKRAEAEAKKALERELLSFQRNVTLGEWTEVQAYLAGLPKKESLAAYAQLITSLNDGPERTSGTLAKFAEKNYFDDEALVHLIRCAPHGLKKLQLKELGSLLKTTVEEGCLIETCIDTLRSAIASETISLKRDELAHVLLEGDFQVEAGEFLPSLAEAEAGEDRHILNLLARHHLALHEVEGADDDLDLAWQATMSVLREGEINETTKREALKRAVQLAPKVHATKGQAWMTESFTTRPERGMELLSLIGTSSSRGLFLQAKKMPERKTSLELQTTAAEALLSAAPERAKEWTSALTLLANNWLQEADCTYRYDTSKSRGQNMQIDPYGNVFYYNSGFNQNSNRNAPIPIPTDEMLALRPSEPWMELISEGLRPRFEMVTAQLLLKVKAEEEAFPYIERLAVTHPSSAEDLVEEFLRVWMTNNNPNEENNRTNEYMFVYGFSQQAAGIPLTRSKQERNLEQLAHWVKRIKALPLERVDDELIATAFSKAHSSAEVYRLETIERVFGALDELEARTVAALVQHMRRNLVGAWRRPATQEEKKTNRRQKDIEREILRGYKAASDIAQSSMKTHPKDWSLSMALASVAHDENNFRQETEKSSEFASRRASALEGFAEAAELYAKALPELKESEESSDLYVTWFYASLGACDLPALDSYKQPVRNQFPLIRSAIEALPGEAAERHMDRFANALFTRVGSVNPAVKFGYLESGLEIAGRTERTRKAHEILSYYRDLITEIRLDVSVDGDDHVGSGETFGLFVNLRHTAAIEREAGGFGKYLVNQNSSVNSFNYGRPTEDYRDKFEEFTHDVLSEHFEVRSITFNHPDTHSRASSEYGWRITPYAYVLLEARGPQVDRVPALRLDLDFMDSVGYALLPIESSPVPVDCGSGTISARPFEQLKLTQTLDEREAAEGKLMLEIQAKARGLLPDLDSLVNLAPAGFEVLAIEDQGASVSSFDAESTAPLVLTERTWTVEMQALAELEELPDSFSFAASVLPLDEVEMTYQRYVDADLASVGPNVSLESRYGELDRPGFWTWTLGLAIAAGVVIGLRKLFASLRQAPEQARYIVPEDLSAFTVIGLLRQIESNNGLSEDSRDELNGQITKIESHYFGDEEATSPDLGEIARSWVQRVT